MEGYEEDYRKVWLTDWSIPDLEGDELEVVKNNIHTPLNSVGFGRILWCWRKAAGIWSLQNAAQVILCHTGLYYISLLKDISFTLVKD